MIGINEPIKVCPVCGQPIEKISVMHNHRDNTDWSFRIGIACRCDREKEKNYDQLKKISRINDIYYHGYCRSKDKSYSFENDKYLNSEVSRIMRNYAEHFEEMEKENLGMFLVGDCGGGKTYYAGCIANYVVHHYLKYVLFYPLSELVSKMRDYNTSEEIKRKISTYPLMVIDDLMLTNEKQIDTVYEIIEARYSAQKPLIVTANIEPSVLRDETDVNKKRIYSRLIEVCSYVYSVKKERDERITIGRENFARTKEIMRQ